jgi:uncharacterized protein (DUF58 family)
MGSAFGGFRSVRRGAGSDIAGSRPYQLGDHFHAIDWKSSARLSSVRGSDDFIVRERYADETPRIVLVVDRRPEMELYPDDLPWLNKPATITTAVELVVASALSHRALVGYLDYASHDGEETAGTAFWRRPQARSSAWQEDLVETTRQYLTGNFDAPQDNVERALGFLSIVRSAVPTGSFVFVFSDFISMPPFEAWTHAIDHGWDVVPVIVQDPIWEQSFPPLGGLLTPFADACSARLRYVRLTAREAEAQRRANEARLAELRSEFLQLGLDSVLLSESDRVAVRREFVEWTETRLELRGFVR